jgi:hypothetical protein
LRIFISALAISLLSHLLILGNANLEWRAPAHEISPPIEAILQIHDATMAETVVTPPADLAEVERAEPAPEVVPDVIPEPIPEVVPEPIPEVPALPSPTPHETVEPTVAALPPPPPPSPPIEPVQTESAPPERASSPIPNAVRQPPERIALSYSIETGDDGFIIGQARYSGQFIDGHYSLKSVAEATGVAAFFIREKIIQFSEGKITAQGLQPDQFWIEKGQIKRPPILFDWVQRRLMLPRGSAELLPQSQDLLSFPFHLAMIMREETLAWALPVTNGHRYRVYPVNIIGREPLTFGESAIETVHLSTGQSNEGSIEVWLAPSRDWLPVRFRMLNAKGKVTVLSLKEAVN